MWFFFNYSTRTRDNNAVNTNARSANLLASPSRNKDAGVCKAASVFDEAGTVRFGNDAFVG